jgi:hypothetical protein
MVASYSKGVRSEAGLAAPAVIGPLDPGHDGDPQLGPGHARDDEVQRAAALGQ